MLPYTPLVEVVYPAMGVEVKTLEFNKVTKEDPVKYKERRWLHPLNALLQIYAHDWKLAVVRPEHP